MFELSSHQARSVGPSREHRGVAAGVMLLLLFAHQQPTIAQVAPPPGAAPVPSAPNVDQQGALQALRAAAELRRAGKPADALAALNELQQQPAARGIRAEIQLESGAAALDLRDADAARAALSQAHAEANRTRTRAAAAFNLGVLEQSEAAARAEQDPKDALQRVEAAADWFRAAYQAQPGDQRTLANIQETRAQAAALRRRIEEAERQQQSADADKGGQPESGDKRGNGTESDAPGQGKPAQGQSGGSSSDQDAAQASAQPQDGSSKGASANGKSTASDPAAGNGAQTEKPGTLSQAVRDLAAAQRSAANTPSMSDGAIDGSPSSPGPAQRPKPETGQAAPEPSSSAGSTPPSEGAAPARGVQPDAASGQRELAQRSRELAEALRDRARQLDSAGGAAPNDAQPPHPQQAGEQRSRDQPPLSSASSAFKQAADTLEQAAAQQQAAEQQLRSASQNDARASQQRAASMIDDAARAAKNAEDRELIEQAARDEAKRETLRAEAQAKAQLESQHASQLPAEGEPQPDHSKAPADQAGAGTVDQPNGSDTDAARPFELTTAKILDREQRIRAMREQLRRQQRMNAKVERDW
jgi:hypothetical protein